MQPPDLSIIIINWNTRQILLDCLATLAAATHGLASETWVVDNGSSDGSVAAIQAAFPEVHLITNQDNRGFAAANNQAIEASNSRYVLLLNSDTLASAGSLTTLVRFLDTRPEVGIVGPRLLNGDGSLQPSWASFPSVLSELLGRNIRRRQPFTTDAGNHVFDVDWVGGACMLVRRSTIRQVGLMDSAYFMYAEEADWCYRTRQQGWQVCYYDGAPVVHLGGQSSRMANQRMKAQLYQSKLRFFRKHYAPWRAALLTRCLQVGFLGKTLAHRLAATLRSDTEQAERAADAAAMLHAVTLASRALA
ncbi:MAG: glycosyltransferase family 2 protein [Chloroflexaceae bacterium]|jgi:hypothetical protein|nr:glycosyltransferase family 2 protein [Chloroflexaceae bacterium]